MSVDLARLPEALRDHGLTVVEFGDWRRRGYDTLDPVGQLNHHTGGSGPCTAGTAQYVVDGRPPSDPVPLPGPLCNELCGLDGDGQFVVYLIAGLRARHAGPGARLVYDEYLADVHDERTALVRGLADDDTAHGNRSLWGREIQHPGSGPWADALIEGVGRSNAAFNDLAGFSANRSKGHKHWTRRKPDPSWAGSLPALAARYMEDDVALTAAEIEAVANRVVEKLGKDTTHPYTVAATRAGLGAKIDALAAKVDGSAGVGGTVDYDTLAAKVAPLVVDEFARRAQRDPA